jgi:hypothetical protein
MTYASGGTGGARNSNASGNTALPNTGSGGGGGGGAENINGGAGGSGIVIVRYRMGTSVLTKLPPALNALEASPTGAYALRKLSTYSGPTVRIEPHPITSWPPAALTGASTTLTGQAYGNGTYTVSSSEPHTTFIGDELWRAFDNDINTKEHPDNNAAAYDGATGIYIPTGTTTTNISGTHRRGGWIQIRLATKVTLRTYMIVVRQDTYEWRGPTTFWIAGSNDLGVTWSLVDSRSGVTYPQAGLTFTVTNPVAYEMYRMVVGVVGNPGTSINRVYTNIATWQLNGDSATPLNTAQDFYADEKGNLAVAPIVGQTLSRALGSNTIGYVTKWYDQSGQGRDLLPVGTVTMAGLDSIDFGGSGSFFDTTGVTGAATAYANLVSGRRLREVLFFDAPSLAPSDRALVSAPTVFGSLSAAATSSAVGAFALRRLNPAYTGPVVQVQAHPTVPWPPVALTGASTTVAGAYGNGVYEVLASSEFSGTFAGVRAFDKSFSTWWASLANLEYTNGVANATTVTASTYQGAWLQIKLPAAVTITSYTINPGAGGTNSKPLVKWYVFGSANGTDWTLVDTRQDIANWASAAEVRTFTLAVRPQAFQYYRIVVNQIDTSGTCASIQEWVLFGDAAAHAPTTATEWPPFPMTAATTSIMGGNYVATSSTNASGSTVAFRAFDKDVGSRWVSAGTYVVDTIYTGTSSTSAGGVPYLGEWVQIQMPSAIQISAYSISPQSTSVNRASSWNLFGSSDGSTWTILDQKNLNMVATTYPISSTVKYSYFRVAVFSVTGSTSVNVGIAEISFTDATVPSPTRDLYADEKGNLALTPAIGQPLADWLGTDVGYVMTWYDQSGKGNHAGQDSAALQPVIMKSPKTPGYMCLFLGSQSLVGMSHTVLKNTNYSFSVVERRQTSIGNNFFISSGATTTTDPQDQLFHVGYVSSTTFRFSQWITILDLNQYPAYNVSNEPLHYWAGTQSSTSGRVLYDKLLNTVTSDSVMTSLLRSESGNFRIGRRAVSTQYYIGEIYEVIMFTSALDSTTVTQISDNQKIAFA